MIVAKYSKTGSRKYISHLDFLKSVDMAIRRSGVPIDYSEGYNPHPLIFFGAPIGIGVESCAEYLCVSSAVSPSEFMDKYNEKVTNEMQISKCSSAATNPNLYYMSKASRFHITLDGTTPNLAKAIKSLLGSAEYSHEFVKKEKTTVRNIRPAIYSLSSSGNSIDAVLGSGNNCLRADTLLAVLSQLTGKPIAYSSIVKMSMMTSANLAVQPIDMQELYDVDEVLFR